VRTAEVPRLGSEVGCRHQFGRITGVFSALLIRRTEKIAVREDSKAHRQARCPAGALIRY